MIMALITCLLLICTSWLMTLLLRHYALKHNMLDIPNERSSHAIATPRGGGLAIIIAFCFGLLLLLERKIGSWQIITALLLASLSVGAIGFVDDHGHVSAKARLAVHFFAAGLLLYALGGPPPLFVLGDEINLHLVGWVLFPVAMVWLVNLYNFMDGIDGIAGMEAMSVSGAAALIVFLMGGDALSVVLPLLLAAAVAGFLLWNLPPAKIFMGDAGSGFLGIALAGLMVQASWQQPRMLWVWLTLLGVFVVDATVTLLRRLLAGENVLEAHRTHAYQHASRRYASHGKVTYSVALINLLWLLPLALLVALEYVEGAVAVLISYLPLVWLAFYFKAGVQD